MQGLVTTLLENRNLPFKRIFLLMGSQEKSILDNQEVKVLQIFYLPHLISL